MSGSQYSQPSERTLRWVEDAVGSNARVVEVSRLSGGLTASMDRVGIAVTGRRFDVVLRRWAGDKWVEWAPGLVDREAAGLQTLADHDLPVPRLLAADRSGEQAGVPSLLTTALHGELTPSPCDAGDCVRQMATVLSRIHRVLPKGLAATDPHGFDERAIHAYTRDPGLVQVVNEAANSADQSVHPPVLVHGDYQPLNMLWRDRMLSGVVDWTYAGSGRREIDVGLCRFAVAGLFSVDAAEAFLRWYQSETGEHVDPAADIRGMLAFEPAWLGFASGQMAGSGQAGHRAMAGRVEAVVRSAVRRLG